MLELPLFPLNTVLFPGMPLNLHIFEEHYKLMVNTCMENRQPFVVLLTTDHDVVGNDHSEPHRIGCTAQIIQMQPLSRGCMDIATVGQERVRIISFHYNKPYLTGTVVPFPLRDSDDEAVEHRASYLRDQIETYLGILQKAAQVQFDMSPLRGTHLALAYLGAALLKISPIQKQRLLAANNTSIMIDELRTIYQREIVLMNLILSLPENINPAEPFSPN